MIEKDKKFIVKHHQISFPEVSLSQRSKWRLYNQKKIEDIFSCGNDGEGGKEESSKGGITSSNPSRVGELDWVAGAGEDDRRRRSVGRGGWAVVHGQVVTLKELPPWKNF